MKLLIVEDEPNLLSILRKGLIENNNEVSVALDGETALEMIMDYTFDVIVLDVMLPKINGIEICKRLRAAKNFVPILLLTALGTSENIVTGLNAGADDYLVKPFEFRELMARIRALTRRNIGSIQTANLLKIVDLEMDLDAKTVIRDGKEIILTAKEFLLLEYFIRHQGRVISKVELAEKIWDITFDTGTNVIEVYMNFLRKKIDKDFEPKLLHTQIGMGYVMKVVS